MSNRGTKALRDVQERNRIRRERYAKPHPRPTRKDALAALQVATNAVWKAGFLDGLPNADADETAQAASESIAAQSALIAIIEALTSEDES